MRIARNALASIGQVVASAVILFILYRGILEALGADRLGIWSVVLATASSSRVSELGLSASVTRFVAKYRASGEHGAAGDVLQTAVISVAALLAGAVLLAYPLLVLLFGKIFPDDAYSEAVRLLPYALGSLVVSATAAIFQSGLDGCQRYDQRSLLVVGGQVVFLLLALTLAPSRGLLGLAWAQLMQGLLLAATGWILIRRQIPGLPRLPHQWSKVKFREMLSYGAQFQVGIIAMMLFEPLTKSLIGKFGGLSAAAYYEMASQLVSKARLLVVSANQVLVPVAATLGERDPASLPRLYEANLQLLFVVVLPLYGIVAAWAPAVSELWIGHHEPLFVFFIHVLALAMGFNTFAGPAYFSHLGTGRIFWNTWSHVWMGMGNAILGLTLGRTYGLDGVVWGMVLALMSGSALMIFGFHNDHKLSWRLLLPRKAFGLLVASVVIGLVSNRIYRELEGVSVVLRLTVTMVLPLVALTPFLWWHPQRAEIQRRIMAMARKGHADSE